MDFSNEPHRLWPCIARAKHVEQKDSPIGRIEVRLQLSMLNISQED